MSYGSGSGGNWGSVSSADIELAKRCLGKEKEANDWKSISDVVAVPVVHAVDRREEWTLRDFCKAIYSTSVTLTIDELLSRAAPFKAFEDPAARKFEHALHRELRCKMATALDFIAFAALVDQVLDSVAEDLVEGDEGTAPDANGLYSEAQHDVARGS
jgi:hypothetical protein